MRIYTSLKILFIGCGFLLLSNVSVASSNSALQSLIANEQDFSQYIDDVDEYGNPALFARRKKKQEAFQKKLDRKIRKEVKREVGRKKMQKKRSIWKRWLYPKDGELSEKPDFLIYKLPHWPFFSLPYEQKDLFQINFVYNEATQAFLGNRTKDITALVFGKECIKIEDILLVSKLAKLNKLKPTNIGPDPNNIVGHPDFADLQALADQVLLFDGSSMAVGASLNFARHFRNGDVSFGVQIPFWYKKNKIDLTNDLDTSVENKINTNNTRDNLTQNGVTFKSQFYKLSLKEILIKILDAKGIKFQDEYSQSGLGDITAFLHYEIPTKKFERLIIGINAEFPTAKERNLCELWAPEMGNGGFTKIGVFGSALVDIERWLNLHFHARVSYSLPASVSRRVPTKKSYDGDARRRGGVVPDEMLALGENVSLLTPVQDLIPCPPGDPRAATVEDASFCFLDSAVRNFASGGCCKTKIRPGCEFFLRVGNIFDQVIADRTFLDLYYDFRMKCKDYLSSNKKCETDRDASIWTKNTYQLEHRAGLDLSWQIDEQIRLVVGGMVTFESRNTPRTWQAHGMFNIEF